jgi:hypothetical protein
MVMDGRQIRREADTTREFRLDLGQGDVLTVCKLAQKSLVRLQDGTAIAADLCRLEAAGLAHTPHQLDGG